METGDNYEKKMNFAIYSVWQNCTPLLGRASTEIINLQSILNLPKGTEHFMSDLHGEYEAFSHVLQERFRRCAKKK